MKSQAAAKTISTTRFHSRKIVSRIFLLTIIFGTTLIQPTLKATTIEQIDPFTEPCIRKIPDIRGDSLDSITLAPDQVINILLLADGFIVKDGIDEYQDFINEANIWYDDLFGPNDGIRPYNLFPQAFRVFALFEASIEHAGGPNDDQRLSFYRVKLNSRFGSIENTLTDGWWNDTTGADGEFRDKFFASLDYFVNHVASLSGDGITVSVSKSYYPEDLDNSIGGDQVTETMANRYRNLYVSMFVQRDSESDPDAPAVHGDASGCAPTIKVIGRPHYVRTALGSTRTHEFTHAFGYLRDEYIKKRDSAATFRNPGPAEKSVFNLCNLSYTSDRCDMLWSHLAPGGKYNPDPLSFIGNLFMGGYAESGVWHSEYKCLINGGSNNYLCDIDASALDTFNLRDLDHLCFWCEEIVAVHILERLDQLDETGDDPDINVRGRQWFDRWKSTLRDMYYKYFEIHDRIAEKNACWASFATGNCDPACGRLCADADISGLCMSVCGIRQLGNAIYVDGNDGLDTNPGRKNDPVRSIVYAIELSHTECGEASGNIIVVKPGDYSGAITLDQPATLITENCNGVTIGGE